MVPPEIKEPDLSSDQKCGSWEKEEGFAEDLGMIIIRWKYILRGRICCVRDLLHFIICTG
jgi:hypothetical protein